MGRSALATVGQMIAAVAVAVVVSVISLIAISRVQWPAFPSSNQLHALTTVGQVGCLVLLLGTGFVWRRGHRWAARIAAAAVLAAFTVVTLGMPLGASRLYLFGISVDQQFRTEYLTRLTASPALHDMTYADLPPFYPAGWFWIGGRAAALTGTPAWEMFKPWAITSIAIAVVLAMALWSALIRFEYALVVATATAAVTLAYGSPEPYAAMITVLIPPVLLLAWSGLRGKTRAGGWTAVVGVGLFLGVSATFYNLIPAYAAFTVAVMAVVVAIARRSIEPLLRLVVIGSITVAIALITWLPFLLRAARQPLSGTGSAQHYLPADGAVLTFPMLQFSLLGALCMLGTLWLVWRARSSVRAAALGIGVLTVYAWSLLSMLTTLAGTTLLSFRLQPTLTVLLSAAGVFGFIEVTLAIASRTNRKVIGVGAAIGLVGAIGFSQDIPDVLRPDLTVAYTDTDGYGQRGDRRPPGAEKYYEEVDAAILKATGRPREDTIVLTADYSFLSYFPYYGFQGLTSHYANPLAEFDKRAAAIESWADLKNADQFTKALDALPWQPPTVFLMRRGGSAGSSDTYTLRLAEDVYPNQPNVRRYTVDLDANLFSGPHFTVTTIGPFVLAIRNP
ncbi:galactan 5-O-arabinofuranosyltransferase [Mycobacterium sp. CVI_P3]|uniref:Galactan 5-O-arabinofuranosyltransferase n=1 Tax=Mycobacterium pinniadriaticum TaxID=2994102 RepID=A0ABT3SFV2_9MYCO|nr:galactan 5-O-arabinofuranosyltransferase [Mycobacterium pinniadriaticum]MCX2931960.1 galactan 5-O-arabinofuranosyltransferase [Mycobacterium pinniadriaticum]MCX2938384.1 galactan 5-O-arabinofuranosyltransferase [Mycobacterium pinniadriaticum]